MPVTPRWRRRKEARPSEIVDAALAAFAERGYAATRLDDVAERAGIGKGTLYLYFSSKEELFKAVVRQTLVPNLAAAEARIATAEGPTAPLLAGVVRGLIEMAAGPMGAIPKLIVGEAANFPDLARFYADEVVARGFGVFTQLIARGVARGEFRPVDPATAAPLLAAPILLTALWKNALEPHATHRMDAAALASAASDLLLHGLVRQEGAT
ncbi:TetR family transcriptional regulator [Stella humosa]|uniref:TetR family transcriptional regulator n=1 Tax=Stella humosa TaxID=94 RepID=A0A3N1MGF9_9PROT|nr:TetR/AcrR family transcriptional regulator [Stella humosa]ROQ01710.1 TetR family transcriptional regulator [Stella humosa]BBK32091.1 TetR family transcriptional regulator [Stella humosa]